MSHFAVAVFSKTGTMEEVEELLETYAADREVPRYVAITKEELIQREKTLTQHIYDEHYKKWLVDPKKYEEDHSQEHIEYLKRITEQIKRTDEEIYQTVVKRYNENDIDTDGNITATYNPNGKWDWYEVGGRWSGMLILRPDTNLCESGIIAAASQNYDGALVSKIDFEKMEELMKANIAVYETAMKDSLFKESYMREKYPTPEEYYKRMATFKTYAVITQDGKWYAPGEMGWFGISSASVDEERIWELSYKDTFIVPAIQKEHYLTIVDCHAA